MKRRGLPVFINLNQYSNLFEMRGCVRVNAMCVRSMCVCVTERERESVCVCVCVRARARECVGVPQSLLR